MDSLISALKLLGIASTTLLGLAGLLADYRDKQRRITKWGWRALAAILASGTLTGRALARDRSHGGL